MTGGSLTRWSFRDVDASVLVGQKYSQSEHFIHNMCKMDPFWSLAENGSSELRRCGEPLLV